MVTRLSYEWTMTRFDKSGPVDAAEKLMLDLMDKHPGASEGSHPLFQNVGRNRPDVLRALLVQEGAT